MEKNYINLLSNKILKNHHEKVEPFYDIKNSIQYLLLYFHTLLGRSIKLKPDDASYISTPLQFTQR